ncbi:MAG: hypothetical protein ACP5VR_01600 [Acidimicrobiales bacterium]
MGRTSGGEKEAGHTWGPVVRTWRLARLESMAFSRYHRPNLAERVSLRAGMLVALVLCERRSDPSGGAVCLLGVRRGRLMVCVGGLVVAVMILGVFAPVAGGVCLVTLTAVFGCGAFRALKDVPSKARLGRAKPPGPFRYVHSFASALPGTGAEVLRALEKEADEKGWWLLIEASNQQLASYYEAFGFYRAGGAAGMSDGSEHVRMWRQPVKEV